MAEYYRHSGRAPLAGAVAATLVGVALTRAGRRLFARNRPATGAAEPRRHRTAPGFKR
jgi:hypothetical protein